MKKKAKLSLAVGILLTIVGAVGIAPTLYYTMSKHGSVAAQAFRTPATIVVDPAKPVTKGYPVSISFPSVKINDVAVVDGTYDSKTQQWTLSLHNAHFAVGTAEPNDSEGQTFIYGHYRPEVFAYLHLIKSGAEAIITTDNGYRFVYKFQESVAVNPDDTTILHYQGPPVLTVQTCSGQWMQNRQMYRFTFDRVEKI